MARLETTLPLSPFPRQNNTFSFFLSSVEQLRNGQTITGGHLIKYDRSGKLQQQRH